MSAGTPNVAPANDAAGAIVQSADTSNVAWVFVGAASRDHLYRVAGMDRSDAPGPDRIRC